MVKFVSNIRVYSLKFSVYDGTVNVIEERFDLGIRLAISSKVGGAAVNETLS